MPRQLRPKSEPRVPTNAGTQIVVSEGPHKGERHEDMPERGEGRVGSQGSGCLRDGGWEENIHSALLRVQERRGSSLKCTLAAPGVAGVER